MGKGNQIIKSRDGESVRTFFFNPYGSFEEDKNDMIEQEREELAEELAGLGFAERRRKVEQMMLDGRFPVKIKDERVYDRQNDNATEEIDNLSYEVGGPTSVDGFKRIPAKLRKLDPVLVAGYHDYGTVIAESDNCQVVIGDNETTIAIGCIPAETRDNSDQNVRDDEYDQLREEAEAELIQTRKRADANYEIEDADIDKLAEEKLEARQEAVWNGIMEKYRKDANAAMRRIHHFFGTQSIAERCGPWMHGQLKQYDELTEEERNNYY